MTPLRDVDAREDRTGVDVQGAVTEDDVLVCRSGDE
jgi:hypothetical protein